jgi:hypothetical protein
MSTITPLPDRAGLTDAVRVQILATEHWSLLATRSMTWNEIFSRAGMFLTVLSAAVLSLALVIQATGFGPGFRNFALLVLPVVLWVGVLTYMRLSYANIHDVGLVIGMNRLRHAYLELAPELEPYFVTGSNDDEGGILQSLQSLGIVTQPNMIIGQLAGTPELVAVINAVVAGVLAALVAEVFGAVGVVTIAVGAGAGIIVALLLIGGTVRRYARVRRTYRARFPSTAG